MIVTLLDSARGAGPGRNENVQAVTFLECPMKSDGNVFRLSGKFLRRVCFTLDQRVQNLRNRLSATLLHFYSIPRTTETQKYVPDVKLRIQFVSAIQDNKNRFCDYISFCNSGSVTIHAILITTNLHRVPKCFQEPQSSGRLDVQTLQSTFRLVSNLEICSIFGI